MSKERLEEIRNRMIVEKQHFKYLNNEKGYWENVYTLLERDMKYLFDTIIEQAERVQELEEENRFQMSETHKNLNKVIYLGKENQYYKQVLDEIYNHATNFSHIEDLDMKNHDLYEFASKISFVAQKSLEGE